MRHCPRCEAEFDVARVDCSDCGTPLVDGPSPRFATRARPHDLLAVHEGLQGESVHLATVRGSDAAIALHDLLADAHVGVCWRQGRGPVADGDPDAVFELGVAPDRFEEARRILADWADPDAIVSDDGSAFSPSTVSETTAPRESEHDVAPPLAAPGLRHCPGCGAEFEGTRTRCSDCGETLTDGSSPRFAPGPAPDAADDGSLHESDFELLATLNDGRAADALCGLLAEAGIATVTVGPEGRRMHAPGHDALGPLQAGLEVEVSVYPEDMDAADALLETWQGRDAIVEPEETDDEPGPSPPAHPGASTATTSTPPADRAVRMRSDVPRLPEQRPAVNVVLLVLALGALVAAAWVAMR
ncbi:MAG TPA: hypothetical protein VKU61_00630 [Candidatus Binatia bacterium]|nr:hypothetical protein [Candidatus Binatia bacterium]